ncbi:MAG: OmpA family protein [Alphaproteobacteria bacterium]|jgi:peptidoglycan-associated lipoprotein|nr:OmpA family protein [Rhodospirillaceae bacterium]MDG2481273.1 OmpA family protein [Alphaproteobacteria bacterium]MBT6205043.1 OmpA family protein [Rhodospirillaceae bacterium]MBT6511803.1 OmpA family protein [Rhodospirillaceae bacterium]MBT7614574.1 OmpA family protein [Rhodospirillaceae bacterium]
MLKRLVLIGAALVLAACSTPQVNDDPAVVYSSSAGSDGLSIDTGRIGSLAELVGGDTVVYFAFNSAALSDDAQIIVRAWAQGLQEHDNISVVVEGHCDERGSREYNLALGEQRASAIRNLLISLGVAGDRVATTSYGKERPVVSGHDIDAWALNRRGALTLG